MRETFGFMCSPGILVGEEMLVFDGGSGNGTSYLSLLHTMELVGLVG
jgi:hypothetical protein